MHKKKWCYCKIGLFFYQESPTIESNLHEWKYEENYRIVIVKRPKYNCNVWFRTENWPQLITQLQREQAQARTTTAEVGGERGG